MFLSLLSNSVPLLTFLIFELWQRNQGQNVLVKKLKISTITMRENADVKSVYITSLGWDIENIAGGWKKCGLQMSRSG